MINNILCDTDPYLLDIIGGLSYFMTLDTYLCTYYNIFKD